MPGSGEARLRARASVPSFASPGRAWMAGSSGATTRCARPWRSH